MKQRENCYNPKRRIANHLEFEDDALNQLAHKVKYGGNPEHKRSPGDYGLTPPASPRPGKMLCDGQRPILRPEAQTLLEAGLRKGMVSVQCRDNWPQNVWALSEAGEVFEAQLENAVLGVYHGYPMPSHDDFRASVIGEWRKR